MMMMMGHWDDSCTGAENRRTLRHAELNLCVMVSARHPNPDGSPVPKRPTRVGRLGTGEPSGLGCRADTITQRFSSACLSVLRFSAPVHESSQ